MLAPELPIGRGAVLAAEYQRRLSGAVTALAAPVTTLPATRTGASATLTGKGQRLRPLRPGTAGIYYEVRGDDA